MLSNLFFKCTKKSLHFYTHSKCSSVSRSSQRGSMSFNQGYQYDEIQSQDSYKIRALLHEIFETNLENGIHLAYKRLIQSIAAQDSQYLKEITSPKLAHIIERQFQQPCQVVKSEANCLDIIYTNITAKIGDVDNCPLVKRLSLFEFINLDVYNKTNCVERLEIDRCNLSIECYVLSPYYFIDQSKDKDSCYHRVVIESSALKKLSKPITIFDLTLLSKSRRRKILQEYFLGKKFQWQITQVDSYQG